MYKKVIIIMVLILLIVPTSFASNNIGDDIGDVLSTDIVTKVNGVAINSFNINGNTAVYVTELRKLGYDVNWNGEERKVTVTENFEKQPITLDTPGIEPFQRADNNQKIGSPIDDVLYTDIVTYMKGAEVESFNINGSTAIYVNDFTRLGVDLEWDGENREVLLKQEPIDIPEIIDISDYVETNRIIMKDLDYLDYSNEDSVKHFLWVNKEYLPEAYYYKISEKKDINTIKREHLRELSVDTVSISTNSYDEYQYTIFDKDKNVLGYHIDSGLSQETQNFGAVQLNFNTNVQDFDSRIRIEEGKDFNVSILLDGKIYKENEDLKIMLSEAIYEVDENRVSINKYEPVELIYDLVYLKDRNYEIEVEILNDARIKDFISAEIIRIE